MWSRMVSFAALDLRATLVIVEKMIYAELKSTYPHFNIADIGPVLTEAIQSGDQTARQTSKDLINLLGDRGFTEFGTLL